MWSPFRAFLVRFRIPLILGAVLGLMCYALFIKAPFAFPSGTLVPIAEGMTVQEAGESLRAQNVLHSPLVFRVFVELLGGAGGVRAGEYVFSHKLPVFAVAWRMTRGDFGLTPAAVTIPEGSSSYEIAALLSARFPGFDAERFLDLAKAEEGYLFPDTYFFLQNVSSETVVATMRRTFDTRIMELESELASSTYPLADALIMASLLEKEARTSETRRAIAGILWKRIEMGMPLQVDAVFGYIAGTSTFHPSFGDLEVESPYNTYRNKGLPPGPIGNPGLSAIRDAISPVESEYLFYLTDEEGVMHYARTFEEHKRNKGVE
jgi:UPF0755 protein